MRRQNETRVTFCELITLITACRCVPAFCCLVSGLLAGYQQPASLHGRFCQHLAKQTMTSTAQRHVGDHSWYKGATHEGPDLVLLLLNPKSMTNHSMWARLQRQHLCGFDYRGLLLCSLTRS